MFEVLQFRGVVFDLPVALRSVGKLKGMVDQPKTRELASGCRTDAR